MNKNLKILSEQAKTYAMNLSSSYGGYEPVSFMDHYTEKLVQLIISESAELVAGYYDERTMQWAGPRIKQHFGLSYSGD